MRKLGQLTFLTFGLMLAACNGKGDDDDSIGDETTGDGDGDPTGDGDGDPTGDGDGDPTGDGDGDPTGDGDGDPTGDGDGDPTGDGDGDPSGDGDGDPNCAAVGVCNAQPPSDPFNLMSLTINGDCLELEVSYSGGCEVHDFTSCWDQIFAESDPVQAWLWIDHDAHDDACDSIVQSTVSFDLSSIRETWQDAYQSDSGTIILHVAGQSIQYDF